VIVVAHLDERARRGVERASTALAANGAWVVVPVPSSMRARRSARTEAVTRPADAPPPPT
jgi:hypothetical protein